MAGSFERRIERLTSSEWQRLDNELDALLQLEPEHRESRLDRVESERPEDAALLRRLLEENIATQRLDDHLHAALAFLAEHDPLPAGTRIGAWRLVRPIGRGGMAEVFLAERADGAFQRRVALKLLWPGLVSENAERHVRQERQILADLDDPRIADLVDGGVTGRGRPWLAMEFVEGRPIKEACVEGRLSLDTRIRLLIDVAEAVASAHRQLVVHGDIKAANILVTPEWKVKLLDFGIGRLIGGPARTSGWKAWTPSTTSPEQLDGHSPTPSSDVYQLGLLMGELVEDAVPMRGRRAEELKAILCRAEAMDPKDRYAGADRFADDLRAYLAHRPVTAVAAGPTYRARCFLRRRRIPLSVVIFLLFVAGVAIGHQLHQASLLAERNAANEAVLAYLEDLLERDNPRRTNRSDPGQASLLEDAATELSERLVDQPRARARVLNALGRIHQARNEIVTAERRYTAALELARKHGFSDALEEALEGLAIAGIWGGDYARSEDALHRLLERRQLGGSSAALDRARLALADLLHSRGKYVEALELALLAHTSDTDRGWSARVLGMIKRDLGRFEAADTLLNSGRRFELTRTPVSDPRMAELSDHVAILELHRGRTDDARQALNESARRRDRYLGHDWAGLRWTQHWNALVALSEDDAQQAAKWLDPMLDAYREYLGPTSHLLAFARSDRAWAALALGDVDTARALFALAAERLESMQQHDHPRLAEVLLGQALIALAAGEPIEARAAAERALEIRRGMPPSTGVKIWRANACHVLRRSGGACSEFAEVEGMDAGPRPAEPLRGAAQRGLDSARIGHAIDGLCSRAEDPVNTWCTRPRLSNSASE